MMKKIMNHIKRFALKIEDLLKTVNRRKVVIKDQDGQKYIEMPLLIAIILTISAPVVALVGFFAGVAARFSIEMEEREKSRIILVNNDQT